MSTKPSDPARAADKAAHFLETTLKPRYAGIKSGQPLKVGIFKDIRLKHPRVPPQVVRNALHLHVSSFKYLVVLRRAKVRVDLDGQQAGEVTKEQHCMAIAKLRTLDRARKREQAQKNEAAQADHEARPKEQVATQPVATAATSGTRRGPGTSLEVARGEVR